MLFSRRELCFCGASLTFTRITACVFIWVISYGIRNCLKILQKISLNFKSVFIKRDCISQHADAENVFSNHIEYHSNKSVFKTYRQMYWLMWRSSALTTLNKLVLYKQILKPVWTYGIQLWGCTKPSNIAIIQIFQNKVLSATVNAPWYVTNADLHRDLKMEMVTAEIKKFRQEA